MKPKITSTLPKQAITELDTRNQLQNIFQNAPAAIAIFNGPQHKFVMANQAYQKQNNRQAKDFLGKSFREVFPELEGTGSFELFDSVYTTGETFTASEYAAMVDSDNNGNPTQHYYNFSLEALKNELKEIYGLMVMAYDITEQVLARKKIEESEERYNTMLMQSPFAFSIFSGKELIITLANDRMKEVLGKGNDIENKPLLEVLPELIGQPFPGYLENVYKTGIPFSANEALCKLKRNGEIVDAYLNFVYQPYWEVDGSISGITCIAYEVTNEVIAKKKIVESEKQFRNLVEQAPVALCFFRGDDFVVEVANEKQLQLTGRTKEQVINIPAFTSIPEAAKGYQAIVEGVYKTGSSFIANESPLTILHNGKEVTTYISFILQPFYNAEHKIDGVFSVTVDVTEQVLARKKIEESEQELRKIKEQLELSISAGKIGTWHWDVKQDILTWSNEQKEIFGVERSEEITSVAQFQPFVLPEDWERLLLNIQGSKIELDQEYDFRIKRKNDGEIRWLKSKSKILLDEKGNIKFISGVNIDVTEQKLFEEKLIEAKVSAENAAKSKQQFLSNMSHEIRTPLNSILGFANVLLKSELSIEQKEFVQAIKTSGKSLNLLINDILDLAKVDAGRMTFEKQPFEMHISITSILHSFELKIKEKNLELEREYDSKIPLMLLGDSVRLNQIILNLMSNAVKFTHKGKIILSVALLNEDEENVSIEFAVTDSGIGIAENKIDSIFNVFEQAEIGTANSYGGTGLGLAIVKQLIEAQGGSISLKSKIGKGSVFSFILPFGKTNLILEEKVEMSKLQTGNKKLRILVAEDVPLNQFLIKIILSDFGFEYEIVGNGKIAIEKMQTNTYDIILMDLQMPEMNGFEATEYIRITMKSQIPIIALTADVTTADFSKCKKFGMDDYISKPINENLLYSKIVALVKGKQ